jgi:imidazolonepropionase-like amidohydrolase
VRTVVCVTVSGFIYASALAGAFQPATTPAVTAIRAGAMLDVPRGVALRNVVVVVVGERIAAVGPNAPIPAGARVLDLSDSTLLPGLIDAHTHLLDNRDGTIDGRAGMVLSVAQASTATRALMGAALGREVLQSGFTTVRDLGNSGVNGDVALRDAIAAGWVPGPRIVAATRALAPAGGQFGGLSPEAQALIAQEYVVISGVEEARRATRQAFYDGADCIKVIINAGVRMLSVEEVKVVVEEAHRVGKKVAAHATTEPATLIAAEAGVDSIEHAYRIPDQTLRIMADKRIFLVPTDAPLDVYMDINYAARRLTAEERRTTEALFEPGLAAARDRLSRARHAGVPIAAGSDMYLIVPGRTRGQASLNMFRSYAESGMSPIDIIRAATINNAELLGRQEDLGSIEPGKLADIIAVPADPVNDLTALQRVHFVMKGGQVVRNDTGRSDTP